MDLWERRAAELLNWHGQSIGELLENGAGRRCSGRGGRGGPGRCGSPWPGSVRNRIRTKPNGGLWDLETRDPAARRGPDRAAGFGRAERGRCRRARPRAAAAVLPSAPPVPLPRRAVRLRVGVIRWHAGAGRFLACESRGWLCCPATALPPAAWWPAAAASSAHLRARTQPLCWPGPAAPDLFGNLLVWCGSVGLPWTCWGGCPQPSSAAATG